MWATEAQAAALSTFGADDLAVTIQDSSFQANSASTSYGGALYLGSGSGSQPGPVTILSTAFLNNIAALGLGGAMFAAVAQLEVEAVQFHNNSALVAGGAVFLAGSCPSLLAPASPAGAFPCVANITGSSFGGNKAINGSGGAVFAELSGYGVLVSNSTLLRELGGAQWRRLG